MMLLDLMNPENSNKVKRGPLSNISVTGNQCVANNVRNLSIVCGADVEFATNTSNHLDNASIGTNNRHLTHCV